MHGTVRSIKQNNYYEELNNISFRYSNSNRYNMTATEHGFKAHSKRFGANSFAVLRGPTPCHGLANTPLFHSTPIPASKDQVSFCRVAYVVPVLANQAGKDHVTQNRT